MKSLRRIWLLASLAAPVAAYAAGSDAATVSAPVSALDDALTTSMKQSASTGFSARYQALAPVVDQSFDLATILHSAVGLKWASLPADQQKTLLDTFRAFTIATYVSNFVGDGSTHFTLLPDTRMVGNDVVVETQVVPASGAPTRIDYLMRQTGDSWKVVDILLEGTISRVAVTRSDFRSQIDGDDASRLIANLQKKTTELAGGPVPG